MFGPRIQTCQWTRNDLASLGITVQEQNQAQFFNDPPSEHTRPAGLIAGLIEYMDHDRSLPPARQPEITGLNEHEGHVQGPNALSLSLLKRLDLAMEPSEDSGPSVTDFAAELLRAAGYEKDDTIVRTHKTLRLYMSNHIRHTKADVFLENLSSIILLIVQADNSRAKSSDPEAQLIATAIAAFQENNAKRVNELFLKPLATQVNPGIRMIGTFPVFYKIQVTTRLVQCLSSRAYSHTIVYRHTPRVPGRRGDGMKPLDNRKLILQCLNAFKKIVYPSLSGEQCLQIETAHDR